MARGKHNDPPLEIACSCGQLQGQLATKFVRSGVHVACHCRDCRAFQLYLKQPDPAPGPVDLFLTTADGVSITRGAQHLGLFRLGPRGSMRWYAACCDTPLFSTATSAQIPFVAIQVGAMASPDRIGPVIGKTFVPMPGGTSAHQGFARIAWKLLPAIIASRLAGHWRQTPFFNIETGAPVASPTIPGKQERAALYPLQRRISG